MVELHLEMEITPQVRRRMAATKALLVDDRGKVYAIGRLVATDIHGVLPEEGFVGSHLSFEGEICE